MNTWWLSFWIMKSLKKISFSVLSKLSVTVGEKINFYSFIRSCGLTFLMEPNIYLIFSKRVCDGCCYFLKTVQEELTECTLNSFENTMIKDRAWWQMVNQLHRGEELLICSTHQFQQHKYSCQANFLLPVWDY
jgi:hypothetical protein